MIALATPRPLPDFGRMGRDAPVFMAVTGLLVMALLPLGIAMALDQRQFLGEPVWLKPVKFHLALGIYLATLAFFARYLPDGWRDGRVWRGYALAVGGAVLAETVWIGGAAAWATASHYNTEVPFLTAIYPAMGMLAVLLTSASAVMAVGIARNGQTGLPGALRLAIVLGLAMTFVLTVGVAGYLSSVSGHFVGTSTRTMGLTGWSRDAGDLRVAHFLATHALHALPLAGLLVVRLPPLAGRLAVLAAAMVYAGIVAFTFQQARAGLPFLPSFG